MAALTAGATQLGSAAPDGTFGYGRIDAIGALATFAGPTMTALPADAALVAGSSSPSYPFTVNWHRGSTFLSDQQQHRLDPGCHRGRGIGRGDHHAGRLRRFDPDMLSGCHAGEWPGRSSHCDDRGSRWRKPVRRILHRSVSYGQPGCPDEFSSRNTHQRWRWWWGARLVGPRGVAADCPLEGCPPRDCISLNGSAIMGAPWCVAAPPAPGRAGI